MSGRMPEGPACRATAKKGSEAATITEMRELPASPSVSTIAASRVFAASNRVGPTSVVRMLPEASRRKTT